MSHDPAVNPDDVPAGAAAPPAALALTGRPARLVVVGYVHHMPGGGGGGAVSTDLRFGRDLATDEQAYVRRVRVGPAWTPLDVGWLREAGASCVVVANETGPAGPLNPGPDALAELSARVVEVGVAPPAGGDPVPILLVRPGEAWPLAPADPAVLRVRCPTGEARVVITAYPA